MTPQASKFEVGRILYLFRCGAATNAVVISAHAGAVTLAGPNLFDCNVPAGMTLHFYAPPGESFVGQDVLSKLSQGPLAVTGFHSRVVGPAKVPNYFLGKFQTDDNTSDDSSYERIRGELVRQASIRGQNVTDVLFGKAIDVATIRNRTLSLFVTLQDVLDALQGCGYTDVHFFACRGGSF